MGSGELGFQAKVVIGDSRAMRAVESESIDLVVTSPPYWQIKDYGVEGQIGYGQSLHEYLIDLYRVWTECLRVLKPGRRLCINVGDQFARKAIYGRYKVIPLHAEIVSQCETLGFDYMGSIIWQKKTSMETSGGAVVMGSYPFPPNGVVELDYEFILLFKKPGESEKTLAGLKESSRLTREEWKEYFTGHWTFGGARQKVHEAMFPDELPRRLAKMFTFQGEVVLDPFLGSGTTIRAALSVGRRAVGYEISEAFVPIICEKLGISETGSPDANLRIIRQGPPLQEVEAVNYRPGVQDAEPIMDPRLFRDQQEASHRVVNVRQDGSLVLESGQIVRFLGVRIDDLLAAQEYLRGAVLGRKVYVRPQDDLSSDSESVEAYVYLKNKIFINSYLIKSGIGSPDDARPHRLGARFEAAQRDKVKG